MNDRCVTDNTSTLAVVHWHAPDDNLARHDSTDTQPQQTLKIRVKITTIRV